MIIIEIQMEHVTLAGIIGTTQLSPGLILGLRPANERRHYFVTPSLIGWAQA